MAQNNITQPWHSGFSIKEIFNDNNGKTSSSSFIGVVSSIVALLIIIALVIFYMAHIAEAQVILLLLDKIITVFGIGAALMGVKSISSSFGAGRGVNFNNQTNPTPTAPPQVPESTETPSAQQV